MTHFIQHDWSSPGAWRKGRMTTVRHMDLAIYIHMRWMQDSTGLEVREVWRTGRGQHEFVFDDPDDVVLKLQVAFVNDRACSGLMAAQRNLKTIMRERAREGPSSR